MSNIYFKLKEASQVIADKIAKEIMTKYYDKSKNELTKTLDEIKDEYSYYNDADVELGYQTALDRIGKTEEDSKETEETKPTEEVDATPEQKEVGQKIADTLKTFGIDVTFVGAVEGPNVTQYEFSVADGETISSIKNRDKEIALKLKVDKVAVGTVEGTDYIGVQVPNVEVRNVSLDEVLDSAKKDPNGIDLALGINLNGEAMCTNIVKMPHILIGGSTGSGKSSGINSMICSILREYSPEQVKLVLIDPKQVELNAYENVPHLLLPIVTDPQKAADTLEDLCNVMDKRYSTFNKLKINSIDKYNDLVKEASESGKDVKLMPYIIIVIDELADLMQTAGKSVEGSIKRITQLGRAAGIHMIVATQRPSVDVITGVIKSNIPSRIAFTTASGVDSKVILDQPGAEKLLGKGDMLYKPMGKEEPVRLQGAFVPDKERDSIIDATINKYGTNNLASSGDTETVEETNSKENQEIKEDIYKKAVQYVKENGTVSAAKLQLEFHISFDDAKKIIDKMKSDGIIKGKEK